MNIKLNQLAMKNGRMKLIKTAKNLNALDFIQFFQLGNFTQGSINYSKNTLKKVNPMALIKIN